MGKRSPHFGHLFLIANQIQMTAQKDPVLAAILSSALAFWSLLSSSWIIVSPLETTSWAEFVKEGGLLRRTNAEQTVPEALKPKPEDYIRKPGSFSGGLASVFIELLHSYS